jgi:hypothetical protein
MNKSALEIWSAALVACKISTDPSYLLAITKVGAKPEFKKL